MLAAVGGEVGALGEVLAEQAALIDEVLLARAGFRVLEPGLVRRAGPE
ncbi:hypothetical protein ACIQCQ_40605 [Streptomyces sp. NPDC088394]